MEQNSFSWFYILLARSMKELKPKGLRTTQPQAYKYPVPEKCVNVTYHTQLIELCCIKIYLNLYLQLSCCKPKHYLFCCYCDQSIMHIFIGQHLASMNLLIFTAFWREWGSKFNKLNLQSKQILDLHIKFSWCECRVFASIHFCVTSLGAIT